MRYPTESQMKRRNRGDSRRLRAELRAWMNLALRALVVVMHLIDRFWPLS